MSKKTDFFGYEAKLTYENQHTGARTFEVDCDLLPKISSFVVNVMKEENFNAKEVIRDFKQKDNGNFTFKTGIGYDISGELLKGDNSGAVTGAFSRFLEYDKEQTKEKLDRLNDFIERNSKDIERKFPNADKFEGFNREYDFSQTKEDVEFDLEIAEFKRDMLENLEDNHLEYSDDITKKYLSNGKNELIKDFLDSVEYRDELYNDIKYKVDDIGLSTEYLVEKLDLKDKLPAFKVFTDEGMAFASDDGGYGYQDKKGRMIEPSEVEKMEEMIVDIKGREFYDNMDMYDIKSWNDFEETGLIVCFEGYDGYQDGLVEYRNYDDYARPTVDTELRKIFEEKVVEEFVKDVKDIAEKDYIKEDYFEELKEKYDKNIEKLEKKLSKFKEDKTKDVSKNEKEETKNKEDKEIDF